MKLTDKELRDYSVTVCDQCRRASCWHGECICALSGNAGIKCLPASYLRKLKLEHPDNYSVEKLTRVCGGVLYLSKSALRGPRKRK